MGCSLLRSPAIRRMRAPSQRSRELSGALTTASGASGRRFLHLGLGPGGEVAAGRRWSGPGVPCGTLGGGALDVLEARQGQGMRRGGVRMDVSGREPQRQPQVVFARLRQPREVRKHLAHKYPSDSDAAELGWSEASAVASTLVRRQRTGEADLALMAPRIASYLAGESAAAQQRPDSVLADYQPLETADRPIVVAVGNDKIWVRICEALGLEPRRRSGWRRTLTDARIVDQLLPSTTHVYEAPDSAINNKKNQGVRVSG